MAERAMHTILCNLSSKQKSKNAPGSIPCEVWNFMKPKQFFSYQL